jgi:hypothetical protein
MGEKIIGNTSAKYPHSSSVTIRSESGFRYLCDNRFKGSAFSIQGYIKKGSEVPAFALQVSEGRLGSTFKAIQGHPNFRTSNPEPLNPEP